MVSAGVASTPGVFLKIWTRYLTALKQRPIRTKMITSGSLYVVGDGIAQFGIEGRKLYHDQNIEEKKDAVYDPIRTARLTFYGGIIFAPLAHTWLNTLEKVKLSTRLRTLGLRLLCDSVVWSPFVCALFPSSLGLLEGKNLEQVRQKVEYSWLATWQKAVMVFGPTQVINLAFVPTQHRLLVLQSVGLCWNIFLSYQNNINNRHLAAASLDLLNATTLEEKIDAQHKIEEFEKKKEKIVGGEGGGAVGVATRLSWS